MGGEHFTLILRQYLTELGSVVLVNVHFYCRHSNSGTIPFERKYVLDYTIDLPVVSVFIGFPPLLLERKAARLRKGYDPEKLPNEIRTIYQVEGEDRRYATYVLAFS